jgi:hypothetical protein
MSNSLGGGRKWAPSAEIIFQSQLSLKNFLNGRQARHEVLRKYPGSGKRTFEEMAQVAAQDQGWPPGAWNILVG